MGDKLTKHGLKHWYGGTSEDLRDLRLRAQKLWLDGMRVPAIAKAVGRSECTIWLWKRDGEWVDPKDAYEIAKRRRKARAVWTEIDEIRDRIKALGETATYFTNKLSRKLKRELGRADYKPDIRVLKEFLALEQTAIRLMIDMAALHPEDRDATVPESREGRFKRLEELQAEQEALKGKVGEYRQAIKRRGLVAVVGGGGEEEIL